MKTWCCADAVYTRKERAQAGSEMAIKVLPAQAQP